MNGSDVAPMVVMVVIALSVAAIIILRGPVGKALARRLEGGAQADQSLLHRLEDMEARLLSAEQTQARVEELEERVDFTERVLAREKPKAQLESGGRS
ncbi:MAG: hypothetical protein ABI679_11725 [Gemmatimonadota bacterium]